MKYILFLLVMGSTLLFIPGCSTNKLSVHERLMQIKDSVPVWKQISYTYYQAGLVELSLGLEVDERTLNDEDSIIRKTDQYAYIVHDRALKDSTKTYTTLLFDCRYLDGNVAHNVDVEYETDDPGFKDRSIKLKSILHKTDIPNEAVIPEKSKTVVPVGCNLSIHDRIMSVRNLMPYNATINYCFYTNGKIGITLGFEIWRSPRLVKDSLIEQTNKYARIAREQLKDSLGTYPELVFDCRYLDKSETRVMIFQYLTTNLGFTNASIKLTPVIYEQVIPDSQLFDLFTNRCGSTKQPPR